MPMVNPLDFQLIRQAQAGHEQSLSAVAKQVRQQVYIYIYRLTLDYHLAQDLTQETVLEMIKALPRLNFTHQDPFWTWIYRTALGKVQHHFRPQGARRLAQKTIQDSATVADQTSTLNIVIRRELRHAVLNAMKALRLRYRNVLVLRCFENLSYHEIATIMGGNKHQARLLFFRAKRSLKCQLRTHGLQRHSLLSVLNIFAILTVGTGKKAAAGAIVSAASLEIFETGVWSGLIGLLMGKVVLATVCILIIAGFSTNMLLQTSTPGPKMYREEQDSYVLALRDSDAFAYASRIVNVHDPDFNGFRAIDLSQPRKRAKVIRPEEILVYTGAKEKHGLIIPPKHWVEMAFDAPILDGPGPDILISGWGCRHLRVVVTDGTTQAFELPESKCQYYCWGYHILNFDLAGENMPFIPQAVRILGATKKGRQGGFELTACQARIRPADTNNVGEGNN